jgi:solute:Na+ symporter, SSS family
MGVCFGISLYAAFLRPPLFWGWRFLQTVGLISLIVFCYISLGELNATIYNEMLQLAITIAGLAPLVYITLRQFHGLHGLIASLPPRWHTFGAVFQWQRRRLTRWML